MYTEEEPSADLLPIPEVGIGVPKVLNKLVEVDGVVVINDAVAVFRDNVRPGILTG